MIKPVARACVLAAVVGTVAFVPVDPAHAHETRAVGRYTFVVGWGTEPAYAGSLNSVQLRVSERASGRPVTDLGARLRVEVRFGQQTRTLSLDPAFRVGAFGTPGEYEAPLLPTRAGTYAFRFTGAIRGQRVDATFTCSATTFDCVGDASAVQFPDEPPSAVELSERIQRESSRASQRLAAAGSDADRALWLAIGALALAGVALVLSLVTVRARRSAG